MESVLNAVPIDEDPEGSIDDGKVGDSTAAIRPADLPLFENGDKLMEMKRIVRNKPMKTRMLSVPNSKSLKSDSTVNIQKNDDNSTESFAGNLMRRFSKFFFFSFAFCEFLFVLFS